MNLTWIIALVACTVACANSERGGSSLRGALEALQRRQRGRTRGPIIPEPDYDALYEFIPPQAYPDQDYPMDIEDLDEEPNSKYMVKLLDENDRPPGAYEYKVIRKKNFPESSSKKESAFRERAQSPSNEKLRDLFMEKGEAENKNDPSDINKNDAEYALLLGELWSKYKYNKNHPKNTEAIPQGVVKLYKDKVVKKRYPDNWGPIAFKKKRSSNSETNQRILTEYDEGKQRPVTVDPIYNGYNIDDDDKDDLLEEYAIAFQPLDDDNLSDLADDDQYPYDNVEKRFPVSKRSSGPYDFGNQNKQFTQNQNKRETSKAFRNTGTDPRVIKDLSKIFGEQDIIKNPVKRSSDNIELHETKPPILPIPHNHTLLDNSSKQDDDSHEHQGHNMHHPGTSGKEAEPDNSTDDHNDGESEKPITIRKKSIDWSDYFGIDKRNKKTKKIVNDLTQDRLRKQYFNTFNKEVIYPLTTFRKHDKVKRNFIQPNSNEETEIQIDRTQAIALKNDNKRIAKDNDSKLDNIDKKLRNMEGLIVDEALHYSNGGEELDSKEEQEMKEKLLSRLAAAYSLEKMRKALKEFKQSLQTQKLTASAIPVEEGKAKRVAVKKELLDNEISASNKNQLNDDFEDEQGAGHYLNGKIDEQFSEGYMGGSGRHRVPVISTGGPSGSCPVLAKIIQRCRGVDLLAGDRGQLFLPLCSLHQICYLCGEAPPTTCDLVFISEADTACDGDSSCQRAARSALMALRELHDNLADEMDGECEASPCLPATLKLNLGWQRALRR